MMTQLLTRSALDHVVQVYAQEARGFSTEPAWEVRVTIQLELSPIRNGPMFQRYQMGELVSLTGDFDGDGMKDLYVRHRLEEVQIRLSREGRLGAGPAVKLPIPAAADVRIYDINADGRSDLVLQHRQTSGLAPAVQVYLSRGIPE